MFEGSVARTVEHHEAENGRAATPITIVLAEDLTLVRRGIRCLVEIQKDFKVVGECADGVKTVSLVARVKPRMLIVALAMPGLNGLEITRLVRERSPATDVIILSQYSKEQFVLQALRNGAAAYVVKHARPSELVRAIRRAVAGQRYVSEPLSRDSMGTWLRRAASAGPDPYETLTCREREVLRLVSEGYTGARIGRRLSISRRTAESHRASIMRKLGLTGRVDLIRYVLEREILAMSGSPTRRSP